MKRWLKWLAAVLMSDFSPDRPQGYGLTRWLKWLASAFIGALLGTVIVAIRDPDSLRRWIPSYFVGALLFLAILLAMWLIRHLYRRATHQ
jgi:uncharacterized membrane protein YfcA